MKTCLFVICILDKKRCLCVCILAMLTVLCLFICILAMKNCLFICMLDKKRCLLVCILDKKICLFVCMLDKRRCIFVCVLVKKIGRYWNYCRRCWVSDSKTSSDDPRSIRSHIHTHPLTYTHEDPHLCVHGHYGKLNMLMKNVFVNVISMHVYRCVCATTCVLVCECMYVYVYGEGVHQWLY